MNWPLLEKYNVSVPRYTSYPTVPAWQTENWSPEQWMARMEKRFSPQQGMSLYIHLPYCEQLCTYCGCNKHITKNHLLEDPYIDAVLQEWEKYRRYMSQAPLISEIHLGGGTPTFFRPAALERLIQGLMRHSRLSPSYSLSFEAHPQSTSLEHLRVLREVGFNRISLGVQDFDPQTMKTINRRQTEAQVRTVTEQARKLGYRSINYDFIYGLPGQTSYHIDYNLRRVEELRPERIAFYSYAHVPGIKPSQRAYSEADLPQGSQKRALYQQGRAGFEAQGYATIAMDHFATPEDDLARSFRQQKLHRNFMGYTPHYTELAIGLGASAISDSWDAYAQNEKTTYGYLKAIQQEALPPVRKGHLLSEEDQRIRRRILSLMCHYEADWFDRPQDLHPALQKRLKALEEDGLLRLFPRQIKVTPTGRDFIRNIAAALDEPLHRKHFNQPTFSQAV